jgi:hypothetical protein
MAKWADYGICAVRYNSNHMHIDRVKIRPDNGDTVGAVVEYSRANVVDALKRGVTFVTILQDGSGNWVKGQAVFVIRINGVEYIKAVDNSRAVDNLENLPEF